MDLRVLQVSRELSEVAARLRQLDVDVKAAVDKDAAGLIAIFELYAIC